ncbi:hypothetical protein BG000_001644 [Podila horticola]|nr:hypothetical protein BG000_001644 [Podila horticola]
MSPSLPPPPRKLSSSSSISSPSTPRPKVNPNLVASTIDDDDDKLDQALAQFLGQSSISDLPYTYQPSQHYQHCRHRARPQSITSVSSLGSGSYSSYSGTHSRRVSQAYLSPLSPTFSDHSTSCPSRSLLERDHFLTPTLEEGEGDYKYLSSDKDKEQEQDMAMAHAAAASCTCGSSVRSNSICSVTQEDNNMINKISFDNIPIGEASLQGLGLFQGLGRPSDHSSAIIASTTVGGSQHRRSLHEIFDSSRLASLKEIVPTEVRHRLSFHLDECWFVVFSPSGEFLASTGRDHSVLIWKGLDTPEPTVHRSIQFQRTVTQIEWSSDSKYLLINMGLDINTVGLLVPECKVYEVATGEVILTRRHQSDNHDIHVNDITWFDATRFITAPETGPVTVWGSASLCRPAQVLVYDLQSLTFLRTMEADSYVDDTFVIMPTFCGPESEMVCAGSETGKLHFWDVESGELIEVLDEHSQHSGWINFNMAMPGMMASCSDDNHIIIWVTKDLSRSLQDEDDLWIEKHTVISPPLNIKNGW